MNLVHRGRLLLNRVVRLAERNGLRSLDLPHNYDLDDLKRLNRCFSPPLHRAYDPKALTQRAQSRLAQLRRVVPLASTSMLDVGAGHGELVRAAAVEARFAVGVDLYWGELATLDRAGNGPVPGFSQADAVRLPFADGHFDVVTSYWAFEHFADWAEVLGEFCRMLRPGGCMYLEFGPLFYSSLGSHLYRFLAIPWVHLLFDEEVIFAYLQELGQTQWITEFKRLNRLTIGEFRHALTSQPLDVLQLSCRHEHLGGFYRTFHDRLGRYPIQDLTCSQVTCLLQRRR